MDTIYLWNICGTIVLIFYQFTKPFLGILTASEKIPPHCTRLAKKLLHSSSSFLLSTRSDDGRCHFSPSKQVYIGAIHK